MVHRDHLRDHRDVLPRVEGHGDLRQRHIQNTTTLAIEARAVDDQLRVPIHQLHHDLDALLLPNGADAEDRRHVDGTDAADLNVVALELVAAADESLGAAPGDEHDVVGDEPMAALNEVKYALRFSDAAPTYEEEADPEDVAERAVERCRRREL